VASDRSRALVDLARRRQPHSAVVADTLHLPHRDAAFDFAIAIAVVHHLSTPRRRVEALGAILRAVRGQVLVFVWALEQGGSRRGWHVGHDPDVMVPWVVPGGPSHPGRADRTYHRFYHLYREGELERDIEAARGTVLRSGYDRDNWWAIATRRDGPTPSPSSPH